MHAEAKRAQPAPTEKSGKCPDTARFTVDERPAPGTQVEIDENGEVVTRALGLGDRRGAESHVRQDRHIVQEIGLDPDVGIRDVGRPHPRRPIVIETDLDSAVCGVSAHMTSMPAHPDMNGRGWRSRWLSAPARRQQHAADGLSQRRQRHHLPKRDGGGVDVVWLPRGRLFGHSGRSRQLQVRGSRRMSAVGGRALSGPCGDQVATISIGVAGCCPGTTWTHRRRSGSGNRPPGWSRPGATARRSSLHGSSTTS